MKGTRATLSRFPPEKPAPEVPTIVVPSRELGDELVLQASDAGTGDDRNHDLIADHQFVQLDQQGRALPWIELDLGGLVGVVIFLVLPARDVAALPFVGLGCELRRQELAEEDSRVGLLR